MNSRTKVSKASAVIDYICDVGGFIGALCILCAGLAITYEVICRYIFHNPTEWSNEMTSYFTVGSVFLVMAYVMKQEGHVRVDILIKRFKPKVRFISAIFIYCITLTFSIMLFCTGVQLVAYSISVNAINPTPLRTPIFIPQLLIPIGGFLLSLQCIKKLAVLIIDREKAL